MRNYSTHKWKAIATVISLMLALISNSILLTLAVLKAQAQTPVKTPVVLPSVCLICPVHTPVGTNPHGNETGQNFEEAIERVTNTERILLSPIKRGTPFVIEYKSFAANQEIHIGVYRYYPTQHFIEPTYETTVQTDAAGNFTSDLGEIPVDLAGAQYIVLASNSTVNALETILADINSTEIIAQRFELPNLVDVSENAILMNDQRRMDIDVAYPQTLKPSNVTTSWSYAGQKLPISTNNPLLPYQVVDPQSQTVRNYAPAELLVEQVLDPLLPGLSDQIPALSAPYFSDGEYKVEVYVNGVFESSQVVEAILEP